MTLKGNIGVELSSKGWKLASVQVLYKHVGGGGAHWGQEQRYLSNKYGTFTCKFDIYL